VILHQRGVGARIVGDHRRHPRVVTGELTQPGTPQPIQAAVSDVADREASADNERHDKRGAHACIGAGAAGRFDDPHVRLLDGGANQIAAVGQRRIEPKRPPKRPIVQDVEHGIDSGVRGNLARVVSPHAVGDDAKLKGFIDRKTIFVNRPDRALLAETPRVQHVPGCIGPSP
jgi:hypothetical protein